MGKEIELLPDDIDQLSAIYNDIAMEAHTLQSLISDGHDVMGQDHLPLVETVLGKIGYLADFGCKRLGGIQVRGGAKDWFRFPTSIHSVDEKAAQ